MRRWRKEFNVWQTAVRSCFLVLPLFFFFLLSFYNHHHHHHLLLLFSVFFAYSGPVVGRVAQELEHLAGVGEALFARAAAQLLENVLDRTVGLKILVKVARLELKHVRELVARPLRITTPKKKKKKNKEERKKRERTNGQERTKKKEGEKIERKKKK